VVFPTKSISPLKENELTSCVAFSANDIIITGKDGVLRGSVGVRTPTDHIKEAKTTSNAVRDRLEYTESRIPSSSRGSMLDSAEAAYISVLEDNLLLIFPSRKSPAPVG